MKRRLPPLIAAAVFGAGCTPLGMMYVHRDTLGIDLATGADTTSPFHITLGQANQMGTYVPVGIPNGNLPVGSAAAQVASILAKDLTNAERMDALAQQSSAPLIDMFSVYSTFATKTEARAGVMNLDRGNTFATGIAARTLAESDRARTCLALEKLWEANKADAAKAAAIRATIEGVCGER